MNYRLTELGFITSKKIWIGLRKTVKNILN